MKLEVVRPLGRILFCVGMMVVYYHTHADAAYYLFQLVTWFFFIAALICVCSNVKKAVLRDWEANGRKPRVGSPTWLRYVEWTYSLAVSFLVAAGNHFWTALAVIATPFLVNVYNTTYRKIERTLWSK